MMKGRDVLKSLVDAGKPMTPTGSLVHQRPAGAVKALNMGLTHLNEEAAEAKVLREALAKGENVVELDPSLVDSSIVPDRLSSFDDPAFGELRKAIETSGQQVPVLVRPHPEGQGKYQAAYGHRRIRAARDLGRKVRAIVRQLTDSEMVIAQGQENGQRIDLSFIERAVFASKLDAKGFDRDTLCAALGVDKPEVSRLLTVAGAIDQDIVDAIGAAPKAGRPRWLRLAEALKDGDASSRVRVLLKSPAFLDVDSDSRFKTVLTEATTPKVEEKPVEPVRLARSLASVERDGKTWRLTTKNSEFASFLEGKLDALFKEFDTARNRAG